MSKTTQKEAVYLAVTGFYGSKFSNGMSHTKEDKAKIVDILVEQFDKGDIEIKSEQENVRTYMIGLLNNHLRKDTRLNGGEKYVAKNPGSRAGQSNPQIKAMRQLAKTLAEGSPERAKVDAKIAEALAEIKAEKAKVEIDVDNLPEDLKALVG